MIGRFYFIFNGNISSAYFNIMIRSWEIIRYSALSINVLFCVLFLQGFLKTVLSKNFFPLNSYRVFVSSINFCLFFHSLLNIIFDLISCELQLPICSSHLTTLQDVLYICGSNLVLLLTKNRYKIFSMIILNPRRVLVVRIIEVFSILFILAECILW